MKSRKETLEEFVAADPDDSFSRYALALELEKEGREADAVVQFREVIARDSGYVATYYHLGKVLARQGHVDEARDVYRDGILAATAANDQRTRTEIQEALEALD
jgi:thioredoxin-like negative regulator of GroEL